MSACAAAVKNNPGETMKPLVYIASPYTKGDPAINTHFQAKVFDELMNDGVVIPFVPLVSHFLHLISPRPYQDWIEYDLALIPRCDACLRLDAVHVPLGYKETRSSGADGEVAECQRLGKPVFYNKQDLYAWVMQQEA
jgi:hypothetical protein